jgi:mannan endo-1,4-beta-mannosidase
VLSWAGVLALGLVVTACGDEPHRAKQLRDRTLIGINHPLASLAVREEAVQYEFPIVGGLYYTFDTRWSLHVGDLVPAKGRELLVCWMPQKSDATLLLSDIPTGKYDEHIDSMLAGMRAFDGPVVVRWGHEANGNWYPWSAASPGGPSPEQYIQAWRYIVERERDRKGASNIRWFWCPSGTDVAAPNGALYPMEQYWPGEAWVDLVGCDAYNEPTAWTGFDDVFAAPYARISALSSKPFWIGEVGCHEPLPGQPGTKGEWIEAMLGSTAFPNLAAICYFDYNAVSSGRADWRLDSSSGTFQSVVKSMQTVRKRVGR